MSAPSSSLSGRCLPSHMLLRSVSRIHASRLPWVAVRDSRCPLAVQAKAAKSGKGFGTATKGMQEVPTGQLQNDIKRAALARLSSTPHDLPLHGGGCLVLTKAHTPWPPLPTTSTQPHTRVTCWLLYRRFSCVPTRVGGLRSALPNSPVPSPTPVLPPHGPAAATTTKENPQPHPRIPHPVSPHPVCANAPTSRLSAQRGAYLNACLPQ